MKNKRDKITKNFLLSFFSDKNEYSEKEVNRFILIKQFTAPIWTVAIYTLEAYLKKKKHQKQFANSFYNKTRGNSESESK